MSTLGKAFIAGVMMVALSIALVAVAEAQPPIRIGASLAQTGGFAALGQVQLHGYYPGAREFVESYKREFPRADLHYLSVSGYGGCQILV